MTRATTANVTPLTSAGQHLEPMEAESIVRIRRPEGDTQRGVTQAQGKDVQQEMGRIGQKREAARQQPAHHFGQQH